MADSATFQWASVEFGGSNLGDQRRTARLVKIACGLAENVGVAISSSCGRVAAQLISRLFEQGEVTEDSVLQSHIKQTASRCAEEGLVIAVQDTTFLDFTGRKALREELGPIGPEQDSRGILMHTVLAVTSDKTPLGVLGVQLWTRDPASYGNGKNRRNRRVADKESQKWIDGLAMAEAATAESQSLLVVGDRESDVFALFAASRRRKTDILVRANQDRSVEDREFGRLRAAVEAAPTLGTHKVNVPRQGKRPAREALMMVQSRAITVKPPQHKTADVPDGAVELYVVRTYEVGAPSGVEPLEWVLMTSIPARDFAGACRIIGYYSIRWVIEEFHRVLKSGCNVERLQFETLARLKPAIAVLSVIAWRVLHLTKFCRQEPDAPALTVCGEMERLVMEKWMVMKKEKSPWVETVQQFVRAVAILGGFMGRKCDGNPGTKTIWQGLRRLEDLVRGYELAISLGL